MFLKTDAMKIKQKLIGHSPNPSVLYFQCMYRQSVANFCEREVQIFELLCNCLIILL